MRPRTNGFTLIELVAVVMILSIVAAAVVIKVAAPLNASNMRDFVDQVTNYDSLTRLQASELDRKLLVEIDLDQGELRRLDPQRRESCGEPLQVASSFRIGMVMWSGFKQESGSVAVLYSRQGVSDSYAMRLDGPSGRSRWILVTGLAGEAVELSNEDEAEQVLAAATVRPDAR